MAKVMGSYLAGMVKPWPMAILAILEFNQIKSPGRRGRDRINILDCLPIII